MNAEDPKSEQRVIPPIGNKKVKSKLQDFCSFIAANNKKRFLVCSHDNPDPDSLASALGISWILQFLDAQDVLIVYNGEISHPQNKTMLTVLDINISPWEKVRDKYTNGNKEDVAVIFVDCSSNSQKNMTIDLSPNIVIDHHKNNGPRDAINIIDEVGACSTLVLDIALLTNKEIEGKVMPCFDPEEEGIKNLTTALAIGIRTDTLEFRSETTTEEDFRAFKLLGRLLSDDKYSRIINYELPPYIFDLEQTAWKNKNENWVPNLITGLGILPKSQTDGIPYLADKMMRLKGVQTVVVFAIIEEDNAVRASIRTISASLDCQTLVEAIFGEKHGGAKQGIGGAVVNFSAVNVAELDDENKQKLWDVISYQYTKSFESVTQ